MFDIKDGTIIAPAYKKLLSMKCRLQIDVQVQIVKLSERMEDDDDFLNFDDTRAYFHNTYI
jgi:hypothetical protein